MNQAQKRHPVLDAIVSIVDHGGDRTRLMEALSQAHDGAQTLAAALDATCSGLPPAAREGSAADLAALHQALAVYQTGLDLAAAGSVVDLVRGAEFVRRSWLRIDSLLVEFRDAALRAAGPSDLADYNHIYHLYVRHCEVGDERLGAAVAEMRARAARLAVRAAEQPPSEVRTELMEACRRHEDVCTSLVAAVEANRARAIERALEALYGSLEPFRELVTRVEVNRRAVGPTPAPQINFLLSIVDDFIAGRADDGDLAEAIETCAGWQAALRSTFLSAAGNGSSASAESEIKQARAALVEQAQGLRRLQQFLDTRDLADLDQGRAALQTSAERLDRAREALDALSETEGRSPCMQCGEYNDLTRKTCGRCGARVVHAETFGGLRSTFQIEDRVEVGQHVAHLLSAINAVVDQTISPQQFSTDLDAFERRLSAALCPPPDDSASDETKMAALEFKAGLDEFHEALATLRAWFDDGATDHLAEGTRQLWTAHGRVRGAQKALR